MISRRMFELEMKDNLSGMLMWAAAERSQAADPTATTELGSWEDVAADLEHLADRVAFRLCEAKGKRNCVPPTAPR